MRYRVSISFSILIIWTILSVVSCKPTSQKKQRTIDNTAIHQANEDTHSETDVQFTIKKYEQILEKLTTMLQRKDDCWTIAENFEQTYRDNQTDIENYENEIRQYLKPLSREQAMTFYNQFLQRPVVIRFLDAQDHFLTRTRTQVNEQKQQAKIQQAQKKIDDVCENFFFIMN